MQLSNQYYTATLKDNIIHVQYHPFLYITLEDAKLIVNERLHFFKDAKFPVLIKDAKVKGIDKSARDFLFDMRYGLKNIKAIAFMESNKVNEMILKIIFHQNTPLIPHKSFHSESDALVWLAQYR